MNNQKNITMIQNLTVEFRAKILKRHLVLPFLRRSVRFSNFPVESQVQLKITTMSLESGMLITNV